MAAALCKRWFCILVALAGLLCLAFFSIHLASNLAVGSCHYRHLRFRPLQLRGRAVLAELGNGELAELAAGSWERVVGKFGLLEDGCPVHLTGGQWRVDEEGKGALEFEWDSSPSSAAGEGYSFNGFFFETNAEVSVPWAEFVHALCPFGVLHSACGGGMLT